MQLQGIDVVAKKTLLLAAPADRLQLLDRTRIQTFDQLRLIKMGAVVNVLDHHQPNEIGIAAVMIKSELDETG